MAEKRHAEWIQWSVNWIILPFSAVVAVLFFIAVDDMMGDNINEIVRNIVQVLAAIAGFIFCIGFTSYISKKLHTSENEFEIEERTTRANKTLQDIIAGKSPKPYFIYLRSFKLENLEGFWYAKTNYDPDFLFSTTIDDELTYAFEKVGADFICLGDNKESKVGAARINTSDQDWQATVQLLVHRATGIIICIGHTESLLEEIRYIHNDPLLLDKTAFIMLPWESFPLYFLLWQDAVEKLGTIGAKLPKYQRHGAIFNLQGKSSPILGYIKNSTHFAKIILDIIPQK
jgi:hypothetical protein